MIKNFLKPVISIPFGRRRTQWFFEQLRRVSLIGLNIGRGGRVEDSGEEYVLKYIKTRLGANRVRIFDVGANVGDWGSKVLEYFDPDNIDVFAFEPSGFTFEKLRERFRKNPNFHLFNYGLGDQNTQTSLFSNAPASGIASLYRRRLDHFGADSCLDMDEMVAIQTLDTFCKREKISNIDFLKLDVEGHELKVLEGAKYLLESDAIRFIQFEFGGCNIDSRTYFQDFFYLLNGKYRLSRILKDGLQSITEYREVDECFITTNYFAEHRS